MEGHVRLCGLSRLPGWQVLGRRLRELDGEGVQALLEVKERFVGEVIDHSGLPRLTPGVDDDQQQRAVGWPVYWRGDQVRSAQPETARRNGVGGGQITAGARKWARGREPAGSNLSMPAPRWRTAPLGKLVKRPLIYAFDRPPSAGLLGYAVVVPDLVRVLAAV